MKYKTGKKELDFRFNYHVVGNYYYRTTREWYKPIIWIANIYWLRYGLDKVINIFILPKDWSLKRKWDYWGGGGRVNWWIRKNITFD